MKNKSGISVSLWVGAIVATIIIGYGFTVSPLSPAGEATAQTQDAGAVSQNSSTNVVNQCLTCHAGLGDQPSESFQHDIHKAKGVTCAGCHGGDPAAEEMEVAMSEDKGFIGVPTGNDISAACAKCHSNKAVMETKFNSTLPVHQMESLSQSVHGKASTTSGEHVAQCTTCHGAHGILSKKNPRSPVYPLNVTALCAGCHSNASFMRTYNPSLPIDQLDKYRTSTHGMKNAKGDAKVAACASCHGSHDIRPAADAKSKVYAENLPVTCGVCHADAKYMKEYGIPTDQVDKFIGSVHGKALLEKHDLGAPACNDCHGNHGAAPPDVASISQVCGTCHALNASLFAESPHKKAFDSKRLPECETCHGNHAIVAATDELIGVTEQSVCSRCHTEKENVKGFAAARSMRQMIDSLDAAEATANELIEDAEQRGMEVTESKFKLRDVRQARLQSRTMVHGFNEEKFREVIEPGLAVAAVVKSEGEEAIDEYYFRRWGLGVATLIITIVAIALYLMIKQIERNQKRKQDEQLRATK